MGILGPVGRPEKIEKLKNFTGLPPWPRTATTFRKNNLNDHKSADVHLQFHCW